MQIKIVENDRELHDAHTVRRQVFIEEQNVPVEEEIDEYEESATHFVMYNEALVPVGAGRFRLLDGIGKVERICILKQERGTGAGKLIMDRIEQYAHDQGISSLKLNAQTHAIPFYSKLGYEIVSGEFLDAGIPHRAMKKTVGIKC
ncbi:GNAT family N-acetyltransferase [Bacillus marasmi]|uniref:GNAT family N-acetyltransferase n=1 Tax=Bacillus marasmi TaxID=1926279 RepID=UPI0011CAAE9F|nr:GNAT family N-acetyltransferase [Bacillus marasmi]